MPKTVPPGPLRAPATLLAALLVAACASPPSSGRTDPSARATNAEIAATASPSAGKPDDEEQAAAVMAVQTVSGTIESIDWDDARITLATASGPVALSFDRNTSVFVAARLGTIHQLAVGAPVRTSFGPARRAFWIEMGPADSPPPEPERRRATAGGPPVLIPQRSGHARPEAPPSRSDAPSGPRAEVPVRPGDPEPNPGLTPPPADPLPAGVPGPARTGSP